MSESLHQKINNFINANDMKFLELHTWDALNKQNTLKNHSRELLILDASFNPPTLAHLRLIQLSLETLKNIKGIKEENVDIWLIYAVVNADKSSVILDDICYRIELLQAFKQDVFDALGTRDIRIFLAKDARFVDKARSLQELGYLSWLIVGGDTWQRILNPKYYPERDIWDAMEELFTNIKGILMCPRHGFEISKEDISRMKEVTKRYGNQIAELSCYEDTFLLDISSTQVRRVLNDTVMERRHQALVKLVPPHVLNILAKIQTTSVKNSRNRFNFI